LKEIKRGREKLFVNAPMLALLTRDSAAKAPTRRKKNSSDRKR